MIGCVLRWTSGLQAAFLFVSVSGLVQANNDLVDWDSWLLGVEKQLEVDPDNKQNLFTRGMLLEKVHRYSEAADSFRKMLSVDPSLLRPRLELAHVLFKSKDYIGSRYHFRQVLAHDIPISVRSKVEQLLARIREEVPSYKLTIEMVSDSNPKKVTDKEFVTINGLSYRLNHEARSEKEVGVRVAIEGTIPFYKDKSWFIKLIGDHNEFEGNDLDLSSGQVTLGRHLRMDGNTVTLEVGAHLADYQHQRLYHGVSGSISDYRLLRTDVSMQTGLKVLEMKYDQFDYMNGMQYAVSSNIVYSGSPVSSWDFLVDYVYKDSKEDPYSYDRSLLGFRYVHEWPRGWVTGVGGAFYAEKYRGIDPIFGIKRIDDENKLEFDVLNRGFKLFDMAPKLSFGLVRHDSSIGYYEWDNTFLKIGLSGEF